MLVCQCSGVICLSRTSPSAYFTESSAAASPNSSLQSTWSAFMGRGRDTKVPSAPYWQGPYPASVPHERSAAGPRSPAQPARRPSSVAQEWPACPRVRRWWCAPVSSHSRCSSLTFMPPSAPFKVQTPSHCAFESGAGPRRRPSLFFGAKLHLAARRQSVAASAALRCTRIS